jgi:AbrB family looped-hinge helix DNA binding protein
MAAARARVTSKGQVTIPAEIRKELGLTAGDRISFVREGGVIRIERAKSWVEETKGMFRDAAVRPAPSARALRRMAEEAWAEEARERDERSKRS